MQVILTQDVPRVGRRYEVVDVSNGYAKNFLFPRKLAETATPVKIAELEKRREAKKAEEEIREKALIEMLDSIGEKTVTITVKADDQGHLYKKLHAEDVATALQEQHTIELATTAILLDTPIDTTGDHEVNIEAAGKTAVLTVTVTKE
jgi:large subunit ribosomal protein L9